MHVLHVEFSNLTLQDIYSIRGMKNLSLESNEVTTVINLQNPQVTLGCYV